MINIFRFWKFNLHVLRATLLCANLTWKHAKPHEWSRRRKPISLCVIDSGWREGFRVECKYWHSWFCRDEHRLRGARSDVGGIVDIISSSNWKIYILTCSLKADVWIKLVGVGSGTELDNEKSLWSGNCQHFTRKLYSRGSSWWTLNVTWKCRFSIPKGL